MGAIRSWILKELTPVKAAACVLMLTVAWAAFDLDRAAHREAAALDAASAAETQQLNGVIEAHSKAIAGIEGQASGALARLNAALDSGVVEQHSKAIAGIEMQAAGSLAKLSAALDTVNRDCDVAANEKACGTLANLNKAIKEVRGSAGAIGLAAKHEDTQLAVIDGTVAKFDALLDNSNATLAGFQPIEKNMEVMSANFAATSTDFQTKFHAVLFPPPCKGKLCFIKKSWPYIHDAGEMTEPAYWGYELWRAIAKGKTP